MNFLMKFNEILDEILLKTNSAKQNSNSAEEK